MTIEIAPPVVANKPTSTSGTTGNKASATGADKSKIGPKGGFMDILASIDGTSESSLALTDPALQGDELLRQDAPNDATLLLAQSLQWGSVPTDSPLDAVAKQALDAVVVQTAALPVTVVVPTPVGTPLRGGKQAPDPLMVDVNQGSIKQDAVPAPIRKNDKGVFDTAALQTAPRVDVGSTPQDSTRLETRGHEFLPVETAVRSATVGETMAIPPAAVLGQREEKKAEHGAFKLTAADGASFTSAGAPAVAGSGYSGVGTADSGAAGVGVDAFVAEKVSYWISNDVQNAEMKLDGIGEQPVEVSIRMHGNEAHVAFRTDEVIARDVLENASQSLKDMLQREGVVLSGVSVGTSGSGESGTQGRNPRHGEKQAVALVEKPFGNEVRTSGVRAVGAALDLFV